MNEMKELEAQLRSWEPRRPSSRIERKLFRRQRRDETPVVAPYAWLAPVTAALLLGCLVFNQHGGSPSAMATNSSLVAMILSNQSAASYLPGSFQQDQNIITANSFEWTNGSRFTSSIHSFSGRKGTNQ